MRRKNEKLNEYRIGLVSSNSYASSVTKMCDETWNIGNVRVDCEWVGLWEKWKSPKLIFLYSKGG